MSTHLETLCKFMLSHKRIVFLTGAGVSKASGIPTYTDDDGNRDPATFDPESTKYQDIQEEMRLKYSDAVPNANHYFPGWLLRHDVDVNVVTQNVDNLYLKAGFPADRLVEFHGNYVRNDIVRFNMPIPEEVARLAKIAVHGSTLIVVAGTGLWVNPFSSLLHQGDYYHPAVRAKIAVFNTAPTSLEDEPVLRRHIVFRVNDPSEQVFQKMMNTMESKDE